MEKGRENLAPIVIFVYNRLNHTQKTIEALKKNRLAEKSEIFIYSDGPKNNDESKKEVSEVRTFIKKISGFKKITIIESQENKGLAKSVINGVTEIVTKYGKIIVLEDDLISSENFLEYMNEALRVYEDREDIWSISGWTPNIKIPLDYNENVYLSLRSGSWGYGTWLNRWEKIDWEVRDYQKFIKDSKKIEKFNKSGDDMTQMLINQMDGKINSWAIRWCYQQFKEQSYSIYPVVSKIRNIGCDGSGVHCGVSNKHDGVLDSGITKLELNRDIKLNEKIIKRFKKYNDMSFKYKIVLLLKKIIRIFCIKI